AGVQCTLDERPIAASDVQKIVAVTRDANVALSIVFERRVESASDLVDTSRVLDAERRLIADRFRGSRRAYVAALGRAGATVALARDAIADQLRRADLEQKLTVLPPSPSDVQAFYQSNPE